MLSRFQVYILLDFKKSKIQAILLIHIQEPKVGVENPRSCIKTQAVANLSVKCPARIVTRVEVRMREITSSQQQAESQRHHTPSLLDVLLPTSISSPALCSL